MTSLPGDHDVTASCRCSRSRSSNSNSSSSSSSLYKSENLLPRSFKLSSRSCKDLLLSSLLPWEFPVNINLKTRPMLWLYRLMSLHQHVISVLLQCISITEIFYKTLKILNVLTYGIPPAS